MLGLKFSILYVCVVGLKLGLAEKCPSHCDNKNVNQLKCDATKNEYLIPKAICNCFPKCETRSGLNGQCTIGSVQSECAPGLVCDPSCIPGNQCTCILDKTSCLHYNFLKRVIWKPQCLPDGSFAPIQCKGEKATGRCFCTDTSGNRIFGEQSWRDADNMTCACSQRVMELKKQGRSYISLHCDSQGNYDELQCDSGLCWCVESKSGDVKSIVVLEEYMEKLPCYNQTTTGEIYLRRCESEAMGWMKLQEELTTHGTKSSLFVIPKCDFDGTYGNYQFKIGKSSRTYFCSWKDNSKIEEWQIEATAKHSDFNCYCARDSRKSQNEQRPFNLICDAHGSYQKLQNIDGNFYCVDADGFPISDVIYIPDPGSANPLECKDWIYQ